jgi:UDP-GlcNAc:undecaprenyl-phosphate GlcNAc-1-phosphate transferase
MSPTFALPILAFVAALLFTPMTSRLAHIKGWVDVPGLRKIHSFPVAYLGGAAVMAALVTALTVGLCLPSTAELLTSGDRRLVAIIVGTLVMFATGVVDDVKDLAATKKLALQMLAALIVVSSGAIIDGINLAEGFRIEFGVFGYLITLLWIVGVTNAVNIIDGLDGLASGLSIVASAAIAWTAIATGHSAAGAVAITLMGAVLGFIPYNLHPARVFLGDAGSLSIGFLLASMAALTATGAPTLLGFGVPLVALGIPILDTAFAMTRRLIERRSMMSPDRNHLHHRLLTMGYGQPATVVALCSVTTFACLVAAVGSLAAHWSGVAAISGSLLCYIALFRIAGAVRIRESLFAVARVATKAKVATEDQQAIDHLQLQLGEADDVHQWWLALEQAAAQLSLTGLELRVRDQVGTSKGLEWIARSIQLGNATDDRRTLVFEVPIPNGSDDAITTLRILSVSADPVDVVARRLGAFARFVATSSHTSISLGESDRASLPYERHQGAMDVEALAAQ